MVYFSQVKPTSQAVIYWPYLSGLVGEIIGGGYTFTRVKWNNGTINDIEDRFLEQA